jgi:hypothetical protein
MSRLDVNLGLSYVPVRAFLHEVRTFLAKPEFEEKLGNIRQLMAADCTTPLEEAKDKAA